MLALKEANYLGKVDHFKQISNLIASATSYPDTCFAENLHYHETLHLSLVLQGGNLEKRLHRPIERLFGTVTYYDPGEPHQSTYTVAGSRHVNLEITDAFIRKHHIRTNAETLENNRLPNAKFLMLQVYKELLWSDKDSDLGIETSVLGLFHLPKYVKGKPAWVTQLDELLRDRWNEKLTLDDLALVAQLHPVSLSAGFTKYFGCTIGEYRRKLKIEKALGLMESTSLSLTDIAFHCDFADQSHLTRTFKVLTGWTPKNYQQTKRK